MKKLINYIIIASFLLSACQNEDWEFPDFDYQTVYFAHQFPVRTITLGEDIFDTSLDNEWKFKIMATTGGVYDNRNEISINFEVDNSLVEGLLFEPGGDEVRAMPSNYYGMLSENLVFPSVNLVGGVEVQLSEAFFQDPDAIKNTYVIPMVITGISNADSILSGDPLVSNPSRIIADHWVTPPKDYTFYAVKYINPWHGFYLRRGQDVIAGTNGDQTIVRRAEFVEWDEVNELVTHSLNEVEFPLFFQGDDGVNIDASLLITFDENDNCTISAANDGYSASGTGQFVKRGEANSWGSQDRDALYLEYEIQLGDMNITTTDTLVMRNRGVAMETFNPVFADN
jgi:hypothetical protein